VDPFVVEEATAEVAVCWDEVPTCPLEVACPFELTAPVVGVTPAHIPFVQTSLFVALFPSSHGTPSAFAGLLHCPLPELQVPTT